MGDVIRNFSKMSRMCHIWGIKYPPYTLASSERNNNIVKNIYISLEIELFKFKEVKV